MHNETHRSISCIQCFSFFCFCITCRKPIQERYAIQVYKLLQYFKLLVQGTKYDAHAVQTMLIAYTCMTGIDCVFVWYSRRLRLHPGKVYYIHARCVTIFIGLYVCKLRTL